MCIARWERVAVPPPPWKIPQICFPSDGRFSSYGDLFSSCGGPFFCLYCFFPRWVSLFSSNGGIILGLHTLRKILDIH